jgi:hypothetical protein
MAAAVCAASAQHVEPIAPARGVYSIGFNFDSLVVGHTSINTLHVTPAYFLTDHLMVRAPLAFDRLPGTNETVYGIGFRWHFGQRPALFDPFIGADLEHAVARHFREDLLAARFGFHYFVANNVALTTLVSIGRDDTNGVTGTDYHITEGFTIFFRDK